MSFEGFCKFDEIAKVKTKFSNTYGNDAKSQIVVTPASLILLGDHTHYNEGVLLTAALDKFSIVQIKKRDDRQINITSTDSTNGIAKSFSLNDVQNVDETKFKTLTCLIKLLHKERFITSGFDCVISTSIPECIGLGTTAALGIGFVTAIKKIFKLSVDIKELFLLVRKNEINIFGKISNKAHFYNLKFAKEEKLLFVDLRTLEYKPVSIPNYNFDIVVCDTGERIINPEYTCNDRITECEVGVKGLRLYIWGIKNLRDVELEFLLRHVHMLPKKIFNRVLYNVKERIRAEQAIKFLKSKSLVEFGKLITESHWSLTEDYEISCDKCDYIVRESMSMKGVYGSKMISCSPLRSTFHLVDKAHSHSFTEEIKKNYFEKFGEELKTYTFNLTSGIKELTKKEIQLTDIQNHVCNL